MSATDRIRAWTLAARLPLPTVGAFALLALALWVDAALNRFLFNVVLALLASVPVAVLLVRGAIIARHPGGPPVAARTAAVLEEPGQ